MLILTYCAFNILSPISSPWTSLICDLSTASGSPSCFSAGRLALKSFLDITLLSVQNDKTFAEGKTNILNPIFPQALQLPCLFFFTVTVCYKWSKSIRFNVGFTPKENLWQTEANWRLTKIFRRYNRSWIRLEKVKLQHRESYVTQSESPRWLINVCLPVANVCKRAQKTQNVNMSALELPEVAFFGLLVATDRLFSAPASEPRPGPGCPLCTQRPEWYGPSTKLLWRYQTT